LYQLLVDVLPWLLGFYVLDGLVRVDTGQLVLIRLGWGAYRARRGGMMLAGLWPTSRALRTYDPPLLVTPKGIRVRRSLAPLVRQEDTEFEASFGEGGIERDGAKVLWGGRVLLKTPSETAAEGVARMLRTLAETDEAGRLPALRRLLLASADLDRLRERKSIHEASLKRPSGLATALFVLTFGLVPALLLAGPDTAGALLLSATLAVVVVHVATALSTRKALRLCENLSASSIFASITLFPPDAMHAPLALGKDLYADFHPLAVAAVFLAAADFETLARRERHRVEVGLEAARGTDVEGAWKLKLELVDAIARAAKVDVARVRSAPERTDSFAATYCPLCFTEYRAGFETCSDCDTPVRAFPA
jgi:hypothetical protein